jgi:hypothetical protein
MKRLLALTVFAIASHVTSAFGGESVSSSKEVVAPAPPPPVSYFQSNEFSVGLLRLTAGPVTITSEQLEITPGGAALTVNTFRCDIWASR